MRRGVSKPQSTERGYYENKYDLPRQIIRRSFLLMKWAVDSFMYVPATSAGAMVNSLGSPGDYFSEYCRTCTL